MTLFWVSVASVVSGTMFFYITGELPYIVSLLDYNKGAYGTRMTSMSGALNFIAEMDIKSFFIGLGSGSASQHGAGHGMEMVYVENAFISLIIDNGMIFFICYLLSLVYFCIQTRLKSDSAYSFVILVSIGVVNLFSANLTTLSVQLLYWTVYFYGIHRHLSVTYPLNWNRNSTSLAN